MRKKKKARILFLVWPYRLTVRTPGSHPGNRGSIPREATKEINTRKNYSEPRFVFVFLQIQRNRDFPAIKKFPSENHLYPR